jgi:hypothetical protein
VVLGIYFFAECSPALSIHPYTVPFKYGLFIIVETADLKVLMMLFATLIMLILSQSFNKTSKK